MSLTFTQGLQRLGGALALGIILLTLASQCGCGGAKSDFPATFAATGRVVHSDGSPYSGGLIEFQTTSGQPVTINSIIQPDGTFALETMIEGQRIAGAPPGVYRVVIMPLMGDQVEQQDPHEPILLSETHEIKAELVNDFTIETE